MFRRVKQFFTQLFYGLPLTQTHIDWVTTYLSSDEETLFWQMSRRDQHHAVMVSMRAEQLARSESSLSAREVDIVVRAGLLHDIGRVQGDVGLLDKVAVVIVNRLFPRKARVLADEAAAWLRSPPLVNHAGAADRSWRELLGRSSIAGRIQRAFYTQAVHSLRGGAMARLWGVEDDVVQLIRHHHDPQADVPLLNVLIRADQ